MEIEKQVAELVNEKVTTAKKETESKIDSVKSELETTIGTKTTEINQSVEAVKTDMSEIKTVIDEMAKNGRGMNVENELLKAITEKQDEIAKAYKSGNGFVEFQVKAVADITTANGVNTAPPTITGTQQAPLSNVNLRQMGVLQLTTQFKLTVFKSTILNHIHYAFCPLCLCLSLFHTHTPPYSKSQ